LAAAVVGLVSNTISGNFGIGLSLDLREGGGVSGSGITGNAIWGNGGVGVRVEGNQPPVLTLSGNDIYQNTDFDLRNDSGIAIVANGNYWGSATTTELSQSKPNLSRIYDIRDGGQQEVLINQWYAASLGGGSPGPLQNFTYGLTGVTNVVSGTIDAAEIWSGTVLVVGDVAVTGPLTISAGTQVFFDALHDSLAAGTDRSRCELVVNGGSLVVAGTSNAPVRLTSAGVNKNPGDWYGVRVVRGDVSLEQMVVEYAVDGIRFEATDTRFATYSLGDVTVQRCSGSGVWTAGGQQVVPLVLNNFQFLTNTTGLSANGPTTLVGGRVVGNTSYGISASTALLATGTVVSLNGAGGGIQNNTYNNAGSTTLAGCVVSNNQGSGVGAFYGPLQMSGCTVSRNNRWGVEAYGRAALVEVWNSVVQSNGSGGLTLAAAVVGLVSNTISGNFGIGLTLDLREGGGVSGSGITGNAIWGNGGVGVRVEGSQPPVLTLSGNDIYQNTDFDLRNDGSIAITATDGYWGEATTTEVNQGRANLSRIYDSQDNSSSGQVLVQSIRTSSLHAVLRFSKQPQSVVANAGETVALSATLDGVAPIAYQWFFNGRAVSEGTSATLRLADIAVAAAGGYYLVGSNVSGAITSAVAVVTVNVNNALRRTITPSGGVFEVSLAVTPPPGTPAYVVEEILPIGFSSVDVNALGAWNSTTNTITWGPFWDGTTRTLTYRLVPPNGFTGSVSLSGQALLFGATTATGGDTTITVGPPGPKLALVRIAGLFAVSITADVGRSYRIEATEALGSEPWTEVVTLTLTRSPYTYPDLDSAGLPQRFYRVIQLP
jgi:hypothetical protein